MRTTLALASLAMLASGCGGGESPDASPTPEPEPELKTFLLMGDITLSYADTYTESSNPGMDSECEASPMANVDVAEGTDVLVSDAAGNKIGLARLGAGKVTELDDVVGGRQAKCTFPFRVESVPAGESVYSIQLGEADPVNFTQADTPLHLSFD